MKYWEHILPPIGQTDYNRGFEDGCRHMGESAELATSNRLKTRLFDHSKDLKEHGFHEQALFCYMLAKDLEK